MRRAGDERQQEARSGHLPQGTAEYRHNGNIVTAMVVLPLIFLIQPLVLVFALPASASVPLSHRHLLLHMLAIPTLVPATLAAYAVVGERQQGTLEPVLTTPIRREECLLGKALAALVPSLAIAYAVYAVFLACVELFARPGVASALLRGTELLAQLLFTPLLAGWSIWVGIAISARSSDVRVAQQLGMLVSLPSVAVTSLIAFNAIHATLGLAFGLAAALLLLDGLGWRISSPTFDRERLITGPSDEVVVTHGARREHGWSYRSPHEQSPADEMSIRQGTPLRAWCDQEHHDRQLCPRRQLRRLRTTTLDRPHDGDADAIAELYLQRGSYQLPLVLWH